MVAAGIADFRPGISLAESRAPDDVDAFGFQIFDGFLHVVDFEGDHAVAEMLVLRRRFDCDALVRDQLDGGAAELQVDEVDRRSQTRLLDPVARPHGEPQDIGVKFAVRSSRSVTISTWSIRLNIMPSEQTGFAGDAPSPRLRGEGWGEGPVRASAAPSKWGPSPFTRKPRCAAPPTSPHKRGEVLACALNSFAAN